MATPEEFDEQQVLGAIGARAEVLSQYWEGTHEEASNELAIAGFRPMRAPDFTCPILDPQKLTSMDLSEYAVNHARFQAWHNYAESTLANINSVLIGVKRQMGQLIAQLRTEYSNVRNRATGKPYSVDDRKALVENTPRYIELLREQTKLEQQQKMMESYVQGLSKTAALISRHIELRKLDLEGGNRNNAMPSRGMYPHR
jgi:hypothetical protein